MRWTVRSYADTHSFGWLLAGWILTLPMAILISGLIATVGVAFFQFLRSLFGSYSIAIFAGLFLWNFTRSLWGWTNDGLWLMKYHKAITSEPMPSP